MSEGTFVGTPGKDENAPTAVIQSAESRPGCHSFLGFRIRPNTGAPRRYSGAHHTDHAATAEPRAATK